VIVFLGSSETFIVRRSSNEKICCSAREKAMKKPIYVRTEPFFELLSGVDSLCMLGKQFTSVISTLDAFFTKVKGQSPLSA
jgi:hypothetical protein